VDVTTPLPAVSQTVLLVDDEDMIRDLGRSALEAAGYHVLEAQDGVDAVDLFRREYSRIDLVVLDLTMPRLSGRDAFRSMAEIAPGARVLFSTGYSTDDLSDVTGAVGMLSKPYRPQDLVSAVQRALADDGPSKGTAG
jgi:CheY-like chemotaxis protein